jgi:hypothetical protein
LAYPSTHGSAADAGRLAKARAGRRASLPLVAPDRRRHQSRLLEPRSIAAGIERHASRLAAQLTRGTTHRHRPRRTSLERATCDLRSIDVCSTTASRRTSQRVAAAVRARPWVAAAIRAARPWVATPGASTRRDRTSTP